MREAHTIRCALLSAALLSWAGPASAQQNASPEEEERPRRVVLLGSFAPVGVLDTKASAREGARAYVANHPELFELVTTRQLQGSIQTRDTYSARLELARDAAKLGIQAYKDLKIEGARKLLTQALKSFRQVHHDIIAPREVADAVMYLALSYLEGQWVDELSALKLFEEMLLLDPGRVLRPGYYPEVVVRVFERARAELTSGLRRSPASVRALDASVRSAARAARADLVLYGVVLPTAEGGHEFLLVPFERKGATEVYGLIGRRRVSSLDALELRGAASRLVGSYASCLYEPEEVVARVPKTSGKTPLSVDLNWSYAAFLRYPEQLEGRPFGNMGMSLGVRWLFTQDFGVVGRLQLLFAQRHYSDVLVQAGFPTVRGFLGAEIGLRVRDFRLAMQTNLDITHVSAFSVWGQNGCQSMRSCTAADQILHDEYGLMLGLNARPVLTWRLLPNLAATAMASASYFFYTGGGDELNFPLSTELGLTYRF